MTTTNTAAPDRIYLQPECCAAPDTGRMWCEHPDPEECEDGVPWTQYVRADLASPPERLKDYGELRRLARLLIICPNEQEAYRRRAEFNKAISGSVMLDILDELDTLRQHFASRQSAAVGQLKGELYR